jgi:quinol-cytochrome oxidoreductase complex cytochrome b subunit
VRMSRKGFVGVYESISRQKSTEEHKVHGVPPVLHFNKLLIAVMFLILFSACIFLVITFQGTEPSSAHLYARERLF